MIVILTVVLALITAASPLEQRLAFGHQTKDHLSVSIQDLRNAPKTVVLGNASFSLTAFPWRDFMPGMWGPSGSPMMVGLKVTNAEKKPFPNGIRMDGAWVLFDEQIWEVSDLRGRITNQDRANDSWINCSGLLVCETTLRDGPKWGPDVFVDVVVRFTDSEGKRHFLQAPRQHVRRSD